jgi:hypothetical protein
LRDRRGNVVQPRWIGVTAVLLLVTSVTTAVLRDPPPDAPSVPVAVQATDPGSRTPTSQATDLTPAVPAAAAEPTPGVITPTLGTSEPTAQGSSVDATEAPTEPLPFEPWTAAPAGRYLYTTDGTSSIDGDEEPLPDLTALKVSDPGRDGFQARVRDLRDGQGYGQLLAYDLHVREDGMELSRITTATRVRLLGGVADTRTFGADPPGSLVRSGDQEGTTHQFVLYSGATTVAVTIVIEGIQIITIDDTDVHAIVMDMHLVFDGDIEGTTTARAWLRVGDLLLLREQVDTDLTFRDVRYTTRYSADLTALAPA